MIIFSAHQFSPLGTAGGQASFQAPSPTGTGVVQAAGYVRVHMRAFAAGITILACLGTVRATPARVEASAGMRLVGYVAPIRAQARVYGRSTAPLVRQSAGTIRSIARVYGQSHIQKAASFGTILAGPQRVIATEITLKLPGAPIRAGIVRVYGFANTVGIRPSAGTIRATPQRLFAGTGATRSHAASRIVEIERLYAQGTTRVYGISTIREIERLFGESRITIGDIAASQGAILWTPQRLYAQGSSRVAGAGVVRWLELVYGQGRSTVQGASTVRAGHARLFVASREHVVFGQARPIEISIRAKHLDTVVRAMQLRALV